VTCRHFDYSHIDSTRNLNTTLFKNNFRRALCNILLRLENQLKELHKKKTVTSDLSKKPMRTENGNYVKNDDKRTRNLVDFQRQKILKSFMVQEIEQCQLQWLEKRLIGQENQKLSECEDL
jgi:hypothetical protein